MEMHLQLTSLASQKRELRAKCGLCGKEVDAESLGRHIVKHTDNDAILQFAKTAGVELASYVHVPISVSL